MLRFHADGAMTFARIVHSSNGFLLRQLKTRCFLCYICCCLAAALASSLASSLALSLILLWPRSWQR